MSRIIFAKSLWFAALRRVISGEVLMDDEMGKSTVMQGFSGVGRGIAMSRVCGITRPLFHKSSYEMQGSVMVRRDGAGGRLRAWRIVSS